MIRWLAFGASAPDMWLLDYHLDNADRGLDLRASLGADAISLPCISVTADHSEAARDAVQQAGCRLLYKPLKPLALRSLMARLASASQ
ncbi:MAG: hypothetical protein ABI650_06235 [Dokdonella sp.]